MAYTSVFLMSSTRISPHLSDLNFLPSSFSHSHCAFQTHYRMQVQYGPLIEHQTEEARSGFLSPVSAFRAVSRWRTVEFPRTTACALASGPKQVVSFPKHFYAHHSLRCAVASEENRTI